MGTVAVWNASSSVPIGLYLIGPKAPTLEKFQLIRLPPTIAAHADARGYLPRGAYLLKPIRARGGDSVCRIGLAIVINGRPVATALAADGAGRALPRWRGCRRLRASEIFVVGRSRDSFDSRYFGPLNVDNVVGRARPLWTTQD